MDFNTIVKSLQIANKYLTYYFLLKMNYYHLKSHNFGKV